MIILEIWNFLNISSKGRITIGISLWVMESTGAIPLYHSILKVSIVRQR